MGETTTMALLDEREPPSVRSVIGTLLAHAAEADFAIARIRLGAVDLSADELAGVRRCRVLVSRLDVQSLAAARRDADPELHTLLQFLSSGRVEVRSAGAAVWTTDFSVFRGLNSTPLPHAGTATDGARPHGHGTGRATPAPALPTGADAGAARGSARPASACLVGAHAFWIPQSADGPSFTAVITSRSAVRRATARFEQLWASGYDVLPVLLHTMTTIGDAP